MKNLLVLFMLLALDISLLNASTDRPLEPNDFQYYVDVEGSVKSNVLYQVQLTTEILQKSAADYKDIRVFAPDKNEIPYVVIENERPNEVIDTQALEIIKYTDDKNEVILDLRLPEKYQPITLIELDIPERDFKKDIILYGSHDGETWSPVAKETIYDFSSQVDLRKTKVSFEKAGYRFYRVKLVDAQTNDGNKNISLKYDSLDFSVNTVQNKRLRIDKIYGKTGSKGESIRIYDEANFTSLSAATDKNHNSIIVLEAALPLNRVYFDISNPYYYRNVVLYYSENGKDDSYRLLSQSSIYSFPLSGLMETKNYIDAPTEKHRFYKFVIENKSNPQLGVKNIRFQWVQKNLYFVALNDSAKNSLYIGSVVAEKPDYDLSSFINRNNWFIQKYEHLKTTQIRQNVNYVLRLPIDKKTKREKMILTLVVILLVIGIGYWLYSLVRKTSKQNI